MNRHRFGERPKSQRGMSASKRNYEVKLVRGPVASATPIRVRLTRPRRSWSVFDGSMHDHVELLREARRETRERLNPVTRYSLSVRLQRLHPVDHVTAAVGLVDDGAHSLQEQDQLRDLGLDGRVVQDRAALCQDRGQQDAREVVAADSERGGVDPVRLKARPDSVRAPGLSS